MVKRLDDAALYQAWREGDEASGNELFQRHFDSLFRFFRHKVPDSAEDLVQQTFLACVRSRTGFRGESSFRTYLFSVARSRLYDYLRAVRRAPIDFTEATLEQLAASLGKHLLRREKERLVNRALAKLPLEMQLALELYYFEEMSAADVAAVLDLAEGTVRSRIRRGLEQLRANLVSVGAAPDLFESAYRRQE